MKITYLGHAGLWIETQDVKILCDPWLYENPAFFGTWSVYPDNSHIDWDNIIKKTDIVFISHVHRDHFDKNFLTELYSKNKNVKGAFHGTENINLQNYCQHRQYNLL